MTAGEKCVQGTPVTMRPCGYIFVERDNRSKNSCFRCEIELRSGAKRCVFYVSLSPINRRRKSYVAALHVEEMYRKSAMTAQIYYVDESSRSIDGTIIRCDAALQEYAATVLEILHLFAVTLFMRHRLKRQPCPINAWIIHLQKPFGKSALSETGYSMSEIVTTMNLLLG